MKKEKNTVVKNKKALHDFFIKDKYEAGLVLEGSEVKSLRMSAANLQDSYVKLTDDNEAYLENSHISKYKHANRHNHDPNRSRKLLLRKSQIRKLARKQRVKNFTIIPLEIYFNKDGLAKVEIALARGKKKHDKRHSIKEKEAKEKINRIKKEKY